MDPRPSSNAASTDRAAPNRRRIVIRKRRVEPVRVVVAPSETDGNAITSNVPTTIPVLRDELAILRAYLGQEIDAILFDEE